MNSKEQAKEALKEATLVFYKAIQTFKKAQPFTKHKAALQKAEREVKGLAKQLHKNLTDKERFPKVVNPNPPAIEQARSIEEPEPEEGVRLADNGETPKAVKQQVKKRRKRGPNKKK
jgi:hypothetical protein